MVAYHWLTGSKNNILNSREKKLENPPQPLESLQRDQSCPPELTHRTDLEVSILSGNLYHFGFLRFSSSDFPVNGQSFCRLS